MKADIDFEPIAQEEFEAIPRKRSRRRGGGRLQRLLAAVPIGSGAKIPCQWIHYSGNCGGATQMHKIAAVDGAFLFVRPVRTGLSIF